MMKRHVRRMMPYVVAAGVGLGLMLGAAGVAVGKKITVEPPPPPPPEAKEKPAGKYDYKHEVRKVNRERKPVVALLRPGDVVELADWLPFGRGLGITDTNPDGTKSQTVVKTGREDARVFMPAPIRQFLTRELLDTGEFVVVERERILEIARELALAKTQAVDPQSAPRPGRLIGVHYILEGSYYPVGGLPANDPALEAIKREAVKRNVRIDPTQACVMYITAYKVETGEVKAVACGADFQPLVAVKRAVEDLLDQIGEIVVPIKVTKVDARTGMALLDIGAQEGVKPGDVFALAPPNAAPATPASTSLQGIVIQVDPFFSVVKMKGETKGATEGLVAHRAAADNPAAETPKDEKPAETKPAETKPDEKPPAPKG